MRSSYIFYGIIVRLYTITDRVKFKLSLNYIPNLILKSKLDLNPDLFLILSLPITLRAIFLALEVYTSSAYVMLRFSYFYMHIS
jgi:hypothetical protein